MSWEMSQAVFSPNLTKEVQWEVSQIADKRCPCMILQGGLSVNSNHLKTQFELPISFDFRTCLIISHCG